jgi:hypothetical protein
MKPILRFLTNDYVLAAACGIALAVLAASGV